MPSPSLNEHCRSPRPSADFHSSVWNDYFLKYNSYHPEMDDRVQRSQEKLKKEITDLLKVAMQKYRHDVESLKLIDAIQRLGVAYHFEIEIDHALQQIHNTSCQNNSKHGDDNIDDDELYYVSLQFRLLRQHGYNISCAVFNKFKGATGDLRDFVPKDVGCMFSLYEAAQYRVHGEDILDEADSFALSYLNSMTTHSNPSVSIQVKDALNQSIRKRIPRLEARRYMSIYEAQSDSQECLLLFAKQDFNMLQKYHQKELANITRWWKDLDFPRKLPFGRDRVVELYFWTLGVYFEPQYSLARYMLTKVLTMTSYLDDIYDSYGTLEEVRLLTEAIERWDIDALKLLPEYLSVFYQALLNVYGEMNNMMEVEGKSYGVYYSKEQMKKLAKTYMMEHEWMCKNHVPTMKEYMKVAKVSSGYPMLATTSFIGMGDMITEDTFKWILQTPKISEASMVIGRLMDDIASHKFEQKRCHVASSVECYMKEFGASEQYTLVEFYKQVKNAWKDINEECLQPTVMPMSVLERMVNLVRVMDILYKDGDGYTHSSTVTKELVASLLVDDVPL